MVLMEVPVYGARRSYIRIAPSNLLSLEYISTLSSKLDERCDFGKLKKYIIFPHEVKVVLPSNDESPTKKGSIVGKVISKHIDYKIVLNDNDDSKTPIIAIVNKSSGGQVGNEILKSIYRYLNPIQV